MSISLKGNKIELLGEKISFVKVVSTCINHMQAGNIHYAF